MKHFLPQLEILTEAPFWRSRQVKYFSGSWEDVCTQIPQFELRAFGGSENESENPFYRTVYRKPLTKVEQEVPIGVVSPRYSLAQHREVAELCIKGFSNAGIDISTLRCELGLSELGEWMNFRVYFPEDYVFSPHDAEDLQLRLECFNSVDGSSRLVIFLGWFRLVCSNGMIIGETMEQLRDVHNKHMDLERIPKMFASAMKKINREKARLNKWGETPVNDLQIRDWADGALADKWGKKAAFRVYQICLTGRDAGQEDPFEGGVPSEKKPILMDVVPGAPSQAATLYDVSQALSWLATQMSNAEKKVEWQAHIPALIDTLAKVEARPKKLNDQADLFEA